MLRSLHIPDSLPSMAAPNGQSKEAQQSNKPAANWDDDELSDDNDELEEFDEGNDDDSADEKVLQVYRRLLSRRVDLVGDYAGNELFLIDGDSLLLRCFSDSKLDFHPGFQVLHAVYNVEHFLHQLVKRKCNFHVVFFEGSRGLCLPSTVREKDAGKYYLARAVIMRHLEVNLRKSHPVIQVKRFATLESEEFQKYLQATSPYFVMMHDGAQAIDRRSKFISQDAGDAQPGANRVQLRKGILWFIVKGYNVALVNGLEWRDTKVMTMVLETRHSALISLESAQLTLTAGEHVNEAADCSTELEKLQSAGLELTERQQLAVVVVSKLLQTSPKDVPAEKWNELCGLFLLHQAILAHLPLSARRLPDDAGVDGAQTFLQSVAAVAEPVLQSSGWRDFLSSGEDCDVSDFLDGRLFLQVSHSNIQIDDTTSKTLATLCAAVKHLNAPDLSAVEKRLQSSGQATPFEHQANGHREPSDLGVLPFSNPVFDKHLESVHLEIDEFAAGQPSSSADRIFREISHWHNAKKPIIQKGPPEPLSGRELKWVDKRNKLFMAEMTTYAASLTNAVGKSLEPETVIVGVPKTHTAAAAAPSPVDSDASDSSSAPAKGKGAPKKGGGGGKTAQKNAGKQAMMNSIAATKAKKEESAGDKIVSAWHTACKNLEAEKDPRSKHRKAREYLASLQSSYRVVVEAECELYILNALIQFWLDACRNKTQDKHLEVTAPIWDTAQKVLRSNGLTKTIINSVELTVKTLELPPVPQVKADTDRKLAFTFALPSTISSLTVKVPSTEFQLQLCGPYLERSFDSKPDSRVDFQPDGWQRKVLDGIDANKSVFVVAPTSAGKTFISFYAMRKVLEADDEGVLIYVAPTKALVNQIAAEIQARYSKKFKYGGKSVWAIHTRDYRINNPTGCQVLVTVPHVLQIMLLAPSNANSWSSRVKRIIFDEVHSIGQAEDGVVWEQLLLMAPCPVIALSATVGNPQEFGDWLATTQKAIGIDLMTVHHPYRYSDLRKYFYVPPKRFAFGGLPERAGFGTLGLEGLTGFNHIHPVAALVDKSRGIPDDLGLEPRDCFELWKAMSKHQTQEYPVAKELDPATALPAVSRKADVLAWEKKLKVLLQAWLSDASSPYDKIVTELGAVFRSSEKEALQSTGSSPQPPRSANLQDEDLAGTTLPMLCRLHEQSALPAILFNYDRNQCEKLCQSLLNQLVTAETEQRRSGGKWEKTLERFEEWKKVQEKNASRQSKAGAKKTGKKGEVDDDGKGSKLDQQRDASSADSSAWELFDPEAPIDGYHFADHTRLQLSELGIYIRQLGRRKIAQWLIDGLNRGIGVHHAGMNRKYRQVVEILFRKGFLRVVIATGTLALGINMPCKTVVFSGDSVFLTALNYRQCAGRAGRRGFDLLGNVVFQGVAREKVCRLISSRLPDLNGHFPITTTLVLRLFTLLHESKNAKYAVSAINALLSQPRLYMGGPSFKDQTMHHLRFSIEYLRRQSLLSSTGATLNFAGLVSHLYFTEQSAFAFHALLKEGYFHELCTGINKNEKDTLETLMLVMAHCFSRIPCRQADTEYREKVVKPSSSIVFLPSMPKRAASILQQHNQQTLAVYKTYVETFVEQHVHEADNKLPLTGRTAGVEVGEDEKQYAVHSLPADRVRSSFVALSGASDDFDTIHDLCQTTRDGVFLEEAVIPHVDVYPEEMEVPLNAWLLDFYKHGDVKTIETANGIRRSDIWFLLNDFSLVMATIIASLLNFMKLKEGTDMDMLDIMGDLDVHDEAEDNEVAASEAESSAVESTADSAIAMPERSAPTVTKKKAKNADSWEDVADEEDVTQQKQARRAAEAAQIAADNADLPAWTAGGSSDEGLRIVLKAMTKLHAEFNVKFRAMWA